MQRVCVFCGSRLGNRETYREVTMAMGQVLADRNLTLVYGGANVGLMGVLADAVLDAGGQVLGVIPDFLISDEIAHQGLTELKIVRSMHERKTLMAEMADAFIALPGGYGTLEEFCEVVTWGQLGLHQKPCGLLNIQGYYDPLLKLLDHAVGEAFITSELRRIVMAATDPAQLLDMFSTYEAVVDERLRSVKASLDVYELEIEQWN